ncbi:hypothetical protein TEA_012261 [Camellia sinensis var. sinensis]|uniref:Uncharacterized protein n=1 Tax=Camellia sinensis var. sinensis TaxID=542762 RepID=A0A4S4DHL3_CAMSN|nr:hypothetical protein TEA_012261 [Camellia sinensis var. sinensis]
MSYIPPECTGITSDISPGFPPKSTGKIYDIPPGFLPKCTRETSMEWLMNMGKMVVSREPMVEQLETVLVSANVSRAANTGIIFEIPGQELETRLTKLEKILTELKEERLGNRLESKSTEGS